MPKHFQRLHPRKALGTGHIGNPLEDVVEISPIPKDIGFCEHEAYCIIRINEQKICFNVNNPRKQCQKFYDKYGENGNQLGVGC